MSDYDEDQEEEFVLSEGQQAGLDMFVNFLMDPTEQVMVLEGYAGTGKSTLVKQMLGNMHKYLKTLKLINPKAFDYEVQLTATTNKAAEALQSITGMDVKTIHSFLGLRVNKDYQTGITRLIPRDREPMFGFILVIDEASMIDSQLLTLIFQKTTGCKILFIGDPAQLLPVKSSTAPVFLSGFKTAKLTEVMRQAAGNPIIDMATQFRNTVLTGEWTPFVPDGVHIIHLETEAFQDAILEEFMRPDWRYTDSKILAWRNETVIWYNHEVNSRRTGDPHFVVGDYAVCNKHVMIGKSNIKTDEMVHITSIEEPVIYNNVLGNWVTVNHVTRCFFPKSLASKLDRIKEAKAVNDYSLLREMEESWIDLRAAFAKTINKSQGSTYNKVFIDLNDIAKCTNGDSIARMMYVGPSRARHTVYLTGDFG